MQHPDLKSTIVAVKEWGGGAGATAVAAVVGHAYRPPLHALMVAAAP